MITEQYKHSLVQHLKTLGISENFIDICKMPIQVEGKNLVPAGKDIFGRDQVMLPKTFTAWQRMQNAAKSENIELQLVSAFRSIVYQCEIIQRKLDRGEDVNDILKVNAAPGFSEHHTGRALDLTTPNCGTLDESFELTCAFKWLKDNADQFGFKLSYPANNPWGISYEPWHWAFQER
ncbi:MAG: D-alanyl-D-alanine carboxypeptidase [Candidatus Azotimanducaceae bacterium]|jgi:D-alanyl-D-alanine carboxypeptidase